MELGLKVQKEVSVPTVDWRQLQYESLQGVHCYKSRSFRGDRIQSIVFG